MKTNRKDEEKSGEEIKKRKNQQISDNKKIVDITIDFTGIRNEEIIEGVNPKQSKGVEMIIRGTYYPIRDLDAQYVRDSLTSIKFFSSKTLEERLTWLEENKKTYKAPYKENHLTDNEIKVKFLKIESPHFVEKLGVDVIQTLLHGNTEDDGFWSITYVYNLFKPKDKVTKANRHSLIFRPDNWKIKNDSAGDLIEKLPFDGTLITINNQDCDELIDIVHNENVGSKDERRPKLLLVSSTMAISYLSSCSSIMPTFEELLAIVIPLLSHPSGIDEEEEEEKKVVKECHLIHQLIRHFTPSVLKSLMQKIIRTRATFITHENVEYSSRAFLLIAFIVLVRHSGSYNQNKHRYVTGLESATKRLAVIIYEDSYIKKREYVTALLSVAYVKQQNKSYIPTLNHFKSWFDIALLALDSNHYYEYKTNKDLTPKSNNILNNGDSDAHFLNYSLLKKIGSFQGDINMFSYIAVHPKCHHRSSTPNTVDYTIYMPLVHCIDQHCCTTIAHFMQPLVGDNDVDEEDDYDDTFHNIFSRVWKEVSSVNGRKDFDYINVMERLDFVRNVRSAQESIYNLKFKDNPKIEDEEEDGGDMNVIEKKEYYQFEYKLDKSWICGLIGPIEVKKAIVVLRTDNIYDMVVIRKPKSRQTSTSIASSETLTSEFTTEEKEEIIELAKSQLRKGFNLVHVPSTLEEFKNAKVWLEDDRIDEEPCYLIQFNNSNIKLDWMEALCINYSIPLFKDITLSADTSKEVILEKAIKGSFKKDDNGILYEADMIFDSILKSYSSSVLKRLLMYINNYREDIKLYEIARDGSAINLSVSLLDVSVNHLLCTICALYPYCLVLEKTGSFHVKNGPFMWYLKDKVKSIISISHSSSSLNSDDNDDADATKWKPLKYDESKPLYPHQRESVESMVKKKLVDDQKGHGIFIEVGLGKTAIAIEYIGRLIEKEKMCDYCVYSAPPSAIENAKSEFSRYGLKFNMVTEDKGKSRLNDVKLEKYVINIIAHDHMRRKSVYKELKKYAPNMLFIVDEFHLASTTNTIRSSIALEISLLSWDFIAMTGTLIRRENPADVINWLEQIVNFYVTGYNYYVAFGALISKKVKTNIKVRYDDIMVQFEDVKERLAYQDTVTSRLGGTASSVNFQKASQLCYNVVDREIVRQVKKYAIDKKEIVFVLASTNKHQLKLKNDIMMDLKIDEKDIFLITNKSSIVLRPEDKTNIKVIITTLKHVTGYTLTACKTCITSVYPSNQATRDQFEGRMNRIGNLNPEIGIITIHCGILSYLLEHYRKAGLMSVALKEFATDIGVIDAKDLMLVK